MKKLTAYIGLFWLMVISGVYGTTYKGPELIGHWAMDEGKDNTLASGKKGGANGVAKDIKWISGHTGNTGKAAYCDGVKSSIELPAPKVTTDTITISGWFKNEGERKEYTRLIAGGPLEVGISKYAGITYRWGGKSVNPKPTLNLQPNQWMFMALSIAPDSSTLFVHNGGTMEETKYEGVHEKVNFDKIIVLGTGQNDRIWCGPLTQTRKACRS